MTVSSQYGRAHYAGQLAALTPNIIDAVRDTGPDELRRHIERALRLPAPAGIDPVVALVTVLAAQIPPEPGLRDRLAWVRGFTGVPPDSDPGEPHPSDVERVAAGDAPALGMTSAARREAVRQLRGCGMTPEQIAERTGMSERTVTRHNAELSRAAS